MKERKPMRLGVCLWIGQDFGHNVLCGILDQVGGNPMREVKLISAETMRPDNPQAIEGLDGLIAVLDHNETGRFNSFQIPTVLVPRFSSPQSVIPSVASDGELIGLTAAEYLIARGVKSLGLLSFADALGGNAVKLGFDRAVSAIGMTALDIPLSATEPDVLGDTIDRWWRHLPLPCGLACRNITMAANLTERGMAAGLRAGTDILVLSLIDDAINSMMAKPTLSAVSADVHQIGVEAMRLMEQIWEGKEPRPIRIPPLGVISRQSTGLVHTQDDLVSRAIQYIHAHLSEPIDANTVAQHLGVSRVTLHRNFMLRHDRSVYDEIVRCRMNRATYLVANTNASIKEIGHEIGMYNQSAFTRLFHQQTGISPLRYRQAHRDK